MMMNGAAVAEELSAKNTTETCLSRSANCTHENVKKARKIGRVCALCHTRVFKFWKARKCVDCKAVFHKTCVVAMENEITDAVAAVEVKNLTSTDVTTTEVTSEERSRPGHEVTPLYATPAPWWWTNVTTVTVDCRRRPTPLTVLVAHGHQLSADLFRGLFDVLLPVRRHRTTAAARTFAPSSAAWQLVVATPISRPRRRRRSAERSDVGPREAGDARQTTRRPSGPGSEKRAWRDTSL